MPPRAAPSYWGRLSIPITTSTIRAATGPRRFALILLVAIAARWLTFGNPVVHVDEEFYWVVAHMMHGGAVPFVDVWDRKPLGLFLVYWPAAGLPLPWGTWAYQIQALACVVATAWLIARLADRAGWGGGATLAAFAYILWLDVMGGAGGQAPVFYNLPMIAAAMLIVVGEHRRARRLYGCAAMLLVGAALQIKYSAVFEGLFFGLWLLWTEWRLARSVPRLIGYAAILAGLALLPTAIAFAAYARIGQADAFVFANFTSILARKPDPFLEQLGNAATLAALLSPMVAMALGARSPGASGDPGVRRFLFAWFAAALAGVALFGSWFEHYGLPVAVPGAACAAGFFARTDRPRWLAPAILLLCALVGQVILVAQRIGRGDGTQLAALADAVGVGPGCLFVYSGSSMLYAETHRCALSRFVFPSHLNRDRENGAIGVDQLVETRRILAAAPAVIVVRPRFTGERPAVRALVLDTVRRRYRLVARRPLGDIALAVYARR